MTTGSCTPSPISATRARPSLVSARQNECGIAQRPSRSLSSYARPDQDSATTWIVYGEARRASAQSSSRLEIAWWKSSSGEADGLST
ncbi:hypothetical protein ACFQ0O_36555 [Saccharopolyspora spinosporotrichia]